MLPTDSSQDQTESRNARLNLRASERQSDLIKRAAEARGKSVTDFILDSASASAENILADRRWFQLNESAWNDFEAALDRPVVFKPRLSESLHQEDPFLD